jgi:hypothetical protein
MLVVSRYLKKKRKARGYEGREGGRRGALALPLVR